MKKAKIMLIAITVFAVVGGALAFKAKTYSDGRYCTTSLMGQKCNIFDELTLADANTPNPFTVWYTTTNQASCPINGLNCVAHSTSFVHE